MTNTGKLSEHFNKSEFQCKDCGLFFPNQDLIDLLEKIRTHFMLPVHINCGTRCVHHNIEVGGASDSQHLSGKAADIYIEEVSPILVYNWVATLLDHEGRGGVGNYPTFTHVDVREKKARWKG